MKEIRPETSHQRQWLFAAVQRYVAIWEAIKEFRACLLDRPLGMSLSKVLDLGYEIFNRTRPR